MARRIWVALESGSDDVIDRNTAPTDSIPTNAPTLDQATSSTVQAAMDESNQEASAHDQHVVQGDDLVDDIITVADALDLVSSNEGDNGVSEVAIESTTAHVRKLAKRWGIDTHVARVESYDSKDGRKLAQRYAIESFSDTVSKLVDTFIAWAANLYELGKKALIAFTNDGKAMVKRAGIIRKAIDAIEGTASDDKIDASDMQGLYVAGKFSLDHLLTNSRSLVNDVLTISKSGTVYISTMKNILVSDLSINEVKDKANGLDFTNSISFPLGKKDLAGIEKLIASAGFNAAGSIQRSFALPGNQVLICFTDEANDNKFGGKDHEQRMYRLIKLDVKGSDKVDVLTQAQLKNVADLLEDVGKALEEKLVNFKDTNERVSELTKELKSIKKEDKNDMTEQGKLTGRVNVARAAVMSAKAVEKATVDTLRIIGASLDKYATRSVKAYGKQK